MRLSTYKLANNNKELIGLVKKDSLINLNEFFGDISLVEVTDDYTVKVKLMGACETCHVSMMTLKNGVEVAVKNAVPKVKKVVEISSEN